MINKIIRNFLAKQVAGRSDDGIMITLKDPKKVELLENIMADLLMRNGIDPRAITSEAQLKTLLNQIEAMTKQSTTSGIRNTQSAKVFDLEGQEIKNTKNIMGGKEVKFDDDLPPPGSRGGKDDIAAPVQSSEESLKNMIEAENKKNIAKIKQRQKMLDDAIEDASPGFANDIKYDSELVAENLAERMGLVYDDLPTKQRLDLYDKAYTGLSKKRFKQRQSLEDFVDDAGGVDESDPRGIDDFIPDPEDMAKGGRVGFRIGSESGKDTSGRDYASDTAASRSVATSPSRNIGGGGDDNQPPQTKTIKPFDTTQTKDKTKKNVLKTVGSFAFNRFLNSMGIPTKDIQKALAIKGVLEQAGDIIFPEGNLQNIKATSPDQRTYNIEATKDMVENLPGGLVKDIVAPAGALVMSPVYDTFQGIQRGLEDPNKGILQAIKDENILSSAVERFTGAAAPLAERFEKGGIARIGLKDGMNRRTFLKFLAGAASIPIVGKILKPFKIGKTVTKVPIIKTDNVAGKPEWFDQLVNKVILEGDDVTKRFATAERQSIHQKTLDDGSVVRVTEDIDDGAVRVEYESLDNVYEDTVQMQYKKPLPDEGDPRPSAEFTTAESGPVGRADGPDDYSIDIDEVGGTSISDLTSDVSKLKEYATGQKQTLKEFVQSKKRKDKARRITEGGEAEMDAVIERQGEFIENDLVDLDPPEFASGGIARMLGE